jgi:hypothetical protein
MEREALQFRAELYTKDERDSIGQSEGLSQIGRIDESSHIPPSDFSGNIYLGNLHRPT